MREPEVMASISDINQRYLYWSDVKYRKAGTITGKELWAAVRLSRYSLYAYVWPAYQISVPVTNHMQEMCHNFDMNFGGVWGTDSIIPKDGQETFLNSSIMEEAIASSQIEGASTTRKVAKEMLRRGRSPRNKAEQMIHNNYAAIRYISENKERPLTVDIILRLHEIMTENTLDNPSDAGHFRTTNDVVVANNISGEVVHTPPDFQEIPAFMERLCTFANTAESKRYFLHPIIKAITIHYLLAYYHPFTDGNGRTARALFYWYMLKSGYFISYNLRALKLAFDELKIYIETKIAQKQRSFDILSIGGINYRQATILSMYRDNPRLALSSGDLVAKFGVSKPTVNSDLKPMIERGLLQKIPINHKQSNYIKGPRFDEEIHASE